jgi:site-specific recombinase XerD
VLFAQLKLFSETRHCTQLKDIDVDFAREFRASWKDGPISSVKKPERFRAFCRFSQTAGWMERNPAVSVARPAAKMPLTLPLSEQEIAKALTRADDARWHALIQALRWSGLRIGGRDEAEETLGIIVRSVVLLNLAMGRQRPPR